MKRIGCFTQFQNESICDDKNIESKYFTICASGAINQEITTKLPPMFNLSTNKRITVLNFEAFYTDPLSSTNILRSDCTEMHSNIGLTKNYMNDFICLSGRGFCGYLTYDFESIDLSEINFKFGNPKFPGIYPCYVVIQLLLEFYKD
jgi:hypothetical protein